MKKKTGILSHGSAFPTILKQRERPDSTAHLQPVSSKGSRSPRVGASGNPVLFQSLDPSPKDLAAAWHLAVPTASICILTHPHHRQWPADGWCAPLYNVMSHFIIYDFREHCMRGRKRTMWGGYAWLMLLIRVQYFLKVLEIPVKMLWQIMLVLLGRRTAPVILKTLVCLCVQCSV